jgi:hypothetical protein
MARLDIRLLHGLAAGAALLVLMGANAEGCGGEAPPPEETTEPGEPGQPCGPGEHLEVACPGHEPGCEEPPECIEVCVPDDVCPEGTFEELVCEPPMTEPGFPPEPGEPPLEPQLCLDPNGCEHETPPGPGQGECQLICVPHGECLPGEHEELICDEPIEPPHNFICLDPNGCEGPPPPPEPGECFSICVPDEECGPGEIIEWVCEPVEPYDFNEGEPPPPEECFPVCVPMHEPEPQPEPLPEPLPEPQ